LCSGKEKKKTVEPVRVERQIAGRTLVLETGRMAKQADGAVVATYGETVVLATAQSAKGREDLGFFPLTVDYRERTYAAGKIPGGFFKREGRPTSGEILTMRLIDRSIRPLFPENYQEEVQVMSEVLATDQENEPDWLAMTAAFAAIEVSSIPFEGPLGSCRIGLRDGKILVNPTYSELKSPENKLNLTVAGSRENIVMVEAGADSVPEETMLQALEKAQETCRIVAEAVAELREKAGKPKRDVPPVEVDQDLKSALEAEFKEKIREALRTEGKLARKSAVSQVKEEAKARFALDESADPADRKLREKRISSYFEDLSRVVEREIILSGKRMDGRRWDEIRPISIEIGFLPRVHGSALFTRGETQALVTTTLGTVGDQQIIDGLFPEYRKRFLLHYNFPPFCVGEVKPIRGVSRREIGHGALAERALEPVLPSEDSFPYTVRVVSDILESNGSSSMASVCGGCLALMDAGVPLKNPVAGIAMGLVMEGDQVAILTDILGSEDHSGDMDFKVAGTQKGINALQMDIKCKGLTREILRKALEQARVGRIFILRKMLTALRAPRNQISPYAPKLERIQVNPEKIGLIIGPGGKNIRRLQEETGTNIEVEDDGTVTVSGPDTASVDRCKKILEDMTAEVEIGTVYEGKVVSVKEFGAFIEILPGQEGLCHVSELSDDFVKRVTDVVRIGDKVKAKVIDVDEQGKIKLSIKAVESEENGEEGGPAPQRDEGREERSERRDHRDGRGGGRREKEDRRRPRSRQR